MDPEREAKINKIITDRLNPAPKPMGLEDFADYRIKMATNNKVRIRHRGCKDKWSEWIELDGQAETNVKWLMLRATVHWQGVHQNES